MESPQAPPVRCLHSGIQILKRTRKKTFKKKTSTPKKKKARLPPRFLENPATISKGSVSCTGNQFYY
jgi:hypothetical protein